MPTLKQLSNRMQVLGNRFTGNVDKNIRRTAIVADQKLVNSTPVDTGRARLNWLAGINSAPREVVEPGQVSQAEVQGSKQVVIGQFKDGDVLYLSNNVHYIGRLNAGSSRQAPAGFIEQAVVEATAFVRGVEWFK